MIPEQSGRSLGNLQCLGQLSMLILGFVIGWPAARGAALALLVAAVVKAFLFDLPHLDGVYRAASLFGLGASLVVVGITLQKFRPGRTAVPSAGAPG